LERDAVETREADAPGGEAAERSEIRRGAAGDVAELQRLEVGPEAQRRESGAAEQVPHRPAFEVVEVHGEVEDPAPAHEPGDEALVAAAAISLEDEVPPKPRPDVVKAAGRAADHLILEGLVAGRAEHRREIDRTARLAPGRNDHLEGIRAADVAGDRLELRV